MGQTFAGQKRDGQHIFWARNSNNFLCRDLPKVQGPRACQIICGVDFPTLPHPLAYPNPLRYIQILVYHNNGEENHHPTFSKCARIFCPKAPLQHFYPNPFHCVGLFRAQLRGFDLNLAGLRPGSRRHSRWLCPLALRKSWPSFRAWKKNKPSCWSGENPLMSSSTTFPSKWNCAGGRGRQPGPHQQEQHDVEGEPGWEQSCERAGFRSTGKLENEISCWVGGKINL